MMLVRTHFLQDLSMSLTQFFTPGRWLILYHYGGIYMDLDSISVRPLTPPQFQLVNFTGLESVNWTGAGVIGVSHPHHWLPDLCLQYFSENFDGLEWGANGPKLMTRVLATR